MCVCVCLFIVTMCLCAGNVYPNRRSYVGVELVQWLCEQCLYVRCRTTAVRVWQVLLELGVLLSGKTRLTNTHTHSQTQEHNWRLQYASKCRVTFQ